MNPESLSVGTQIGPKRQRNFVSPWEGPLRLFCSLCCLFMENRCMCGVNFLDGFRFDPERPYLAVQSKKGLKQGAPATNNTRGPSHPHTRENQTSWLGGAHWSGEDSESKAFTVSFPVTSLPCEGNGCAFCSLFFLNQPIFIKYQLCIHSIPVFHRMPVSNYAGGWVLRFDFFFQFYEAIIDKYHCKICEVYIVMISYAYTLWNDSSHLVNPFITTHTYLFFFLPLWWKHLSSTLLKISTI